MEQPGNTCAIDLPEPIGLEAQQEGKSPFTAGGIDIEAFLESDTEAEPEAKPEAEPESQPEPGAAPETQPKRVAQPEPTAPPGADSASEAQPDPSAGPKTEAKASVLTMALQAVVAYIDTQGTNLVRLRGVDETALKDVEKELDDLTSRTNDRDKKIRLAAQDASNKLHPRRD